MVLIVETGAVGVETDGRRRGRIRDLDGAQVDTVLRRGDHVVVGRGTVRRVRNGGPTPAVVLVVAIEPIAVASTSPSMVAREPGSTRF